MFDTPILLIIFNRLETTRLVIEQIRAIRPAQLFIAADGARKEVEDEVEKCEEVRQWVLNQINWKCELKTLFREENFGCGRGPAASIDWFFSQVDRGIILEDDVLPTPSFFLFCDRMLMQFEARKDIMHISGSNFQLSRIGEADYYLSKLPHIWGWATWKRAWQKYDFEMKNFNDSEKHSYYDYNTIDNYWHNIFLKTKNGLHHHVWDYQWVFTILYHGGLSILPQYNLTTNIGFGENSTHTSDCNGPMASLKVYNMLFNCQDHNLTYNPIPDINFHKFLQWELEDRSPINITAAEAIALLFKKVKGKLLGNV